jgi:Protein of unknown function (DUF2480)
MSLEKKDKLTSGVTPLLRRGDGGEASEVINRIQTSNLITLDLENYYTPGERIFYDLKPLLFQELILKEKDFRAALKATDWSIYQNKHVSIGCTADAIIPTWAYMLLAIQLQPLAKTVFFGSLIEMESHLFRTALSTLNWGDFKGAKVVVKGCSKVQVPEAIYVEVAIRLKPLVTSMMFGEPCSTVPLFKAPKV